MSQVNPSNLLDRLLPLDALPEWVRVESGHEDTQAQMVSLPPRMTQLIARLRIRFASYPRERAEWAERFVQLFGGNLLGVAQRLPNGYCICVDLARRIILDRANRQRMTLPSDVMLFLETLNATLIELAANEFPEIAQPESNKRGSKKRAILDFYLNTVGTPLQEKLGARVHLALARKSQGLIANGSKDLQESLRAQIAPLRAMLRKDHPFDFKLLPALEAIDRRHSVAYRALRDIHEFFAGLPSERDKSRTLSEATANDYWGVLRAVLDPLVLGSGVGAARHLQATYTTAWLRAMDYDPPEDEDDPYFRARYRDAAEQESLALGEGADVISLDERELLPLAQWLPRVNYARECAVLQLHTTIYDTTTIPLRHLAMGYAALLDAQVSIEKLPYHQLAPLALWHLLVTRANA